MIATYKIQTAIINRLKELVQIPGTKPEEYYWRINDEISAINTAETLTCPLVTVVSDGVDEKQNVQIFVDLGETNDFQSNEYYNNVDADQDGNGGTVGYDGIVYQLPVQVWAFIKTAEGAYINLWREVIGQAILRCLNNFTIKLQSGGTVGNTRCVCERMTRPPAQAERTAEMESFIRLDFSIEVDR